MNYVKNQVATIEAIFGKKLEGDDLTDMFELVGEIYNDGLADKLDIDEAPDALKVREVEATTLEKFI